MFILWEIICVSSDSIPKNAELDTESIRDKAKIYTKSNLNDYQKCINSASADLYMHNPALLLGKNGELFKLAQEKSASRRLPVQKREKSIQELVPEDDTQTKRPRLDSATRHERMMELQDSISDIDRSIGFKQCRIETTATHNFKTWWVIPRDIKFKGREERAHSWASIASKENNQVILVPQAQRHSSNFNWPFQRRGEW